MNANIIIELISSHSKILEVLDHLESRIRNTTLIVDICQGAIGYRSISPGEDG